MSVARRSRFRTASVRNVGSRTTFGSSASLKSVTLAFPMLTGGAAIGYMLISNPTYCESAAKDPLAWLKAKVFGESTEKTVHESSQTKSEPSPADSSESKTIEEPVIKDSNTGKVYQKVKVGIGSGGGGRIARNES